jgi:hypothetical protein
VAALQVSNRTNDQFSFRSPRSAPRATCFRDAGCLALRKGVSQLLSRPCCCWMRGDRVMSHNWIDGQCEDLRPPAGSSGVSSAKNLRGDGFQLVVMMQAAETWPGNDAMSSS